MVLSMKGQMWIGQDECFIHGEGQFGGRQEKEGVTDVSISGLGKTDQGVRWFQNTPVPPYCHTLSSQQHALCQTYHPHAWLKLGGIHPSGTVTDNGAEFCDQSILFEEHSQNTVSGCVHSVHWLSQPTPFFYGWRRKGKPLLLLGGCSSPFLHQLPNMDSQVRRRTVVGCVGLTEGRNEHGRSAEWLTHQPAEFEGTPRGSAQQ